MRLTDEQIGAELTALRETPGERFAARLDERAAKGFPRDPDASGSRPVWSQRFADRLAPLRGGRLLPAFGAAATLIVVAGLAISQSDLIGQGGSDDGSLQPTRPEQASGDRGAVTTENHSRSVEPGAAIETTTVAPVPPSPPTDPDLKAGREQRVQERSASMTLSADADEVAEIADEVVDVTDRYGGFVVSSNVNTGDRGRARASFDLRIPAGNLQAALADLSDLAHVASRNEGTLDITAPFVSAEERFRDARAEVSVLLERLADAGSADEIASIREQLGDARGELASARSELGRLKQRAGFSRLSLSIVSEGDGDGWSLGDAADDALSVLEALGGAALVTLAVVVPLGLLGAGLWLGVARWRRRQREQALDRG